MAASARDDSTRSDFTGAPRPANTAGPAFASVAPWPTPLDPAAYYGIAGEIVRAIEPHSEADPAALLGQLLVGFGSLIGRGPHFVAEADSHYTNLFLVLVGETAKARKGASWGQVRSVLAAVDSSWADKRILSGLSSGEGLIRHAQDKAPVEAKVKPAGAGKAENESPTAEASEPARQRASDKRLLVLEPELASPLRRMERDGNTLSTVIREAWDRDILQTLTKISPLRVSGAHVSLIAHITAEELRRCIGRTDMLNGFANRFLWFAARRSKELPEGGSLLAANPSFFRSFVERLKEAARFARSLANAEVRRDDEARSLWHEIYSELSEGRPGLLGAATSRAEAQVMRLALLYALLDCSEQIRQVHLEAGLAVWEYSVRSATYIFGDAVGDQDANSVVALLTQHPLGLARTQISGLAFSRNYTSRQLDRVRDQLRARGLLQVASHGKVGRPAERWRLTPESPQERESFEPLYLDEEE